MQEIAAEFPWEIVPQPAAGEKRTGYFTWPDAALQGLQFPYIAVRGRQPGRAVAVIAAVHGGEYPGILGALRLSRVLNPERVRGSLLILPILNLPSFWGRSAFVTPQDGRNLNRVFPGRVDGTFSEVLAHRVMTDIVTPSDALIDLHSGDVFEALASFTARYMTGNPAMDELTKAMCESFGAPYALSYAFPVRPGGMAGNAVLLGKAVLFVEVGGNALASDDDVYVVYQGLVNALRVLGVLEGLRPPGEVRWMKHGTSIDAPLDGLWRPVVALGQQVRPGELLGTLTDPLGEEIARITAGIPGMILYHFTSLAARKGDPLVTLAVG